MHYGQYFATFTVNMLLPVLHRFSEFTLLTMSCVGIHSSLAFLLFNHCKSGISLYPQVFFWHERVINIMSFTLFFSLTNKLLLTVLCSYQINILRNLSYSMKSVFQFSLITIKESFCLISTGTLVNMEWFLFILIFREANPSIMRSLFSICGGII